MGTILVPVSVTVTYQHGPIRLPLVQEKVLGQREHLVFLREFRQSVTVKTAGRRIESDSE